MLRLDGKNPLAYMGQRSLTSNRTVVNPNPPTVNDVYDFKIGDVWVVPVANPTQAAMGTPSNQYYVLTGQSIPGVQSNYATWKRLRSTSGSSGSIINVVNITESGSYTPSPGVEQIVVECIGGGGGSAGIVLPDSSGSAAVTGGGAAGGYVKKTFAGTDIAGSITVTIGAGGIAGTGGTSGSATNGGTGGTTTFASATPLVANGGAGSISSTGNLIAIGGTATGGDLNIQGQGGGYSVLNIEVVDGSEVLVNGYYIGIGGNTMYGSGGVATVTSSGGGIDTTPNDGTGYGSGASGNQSLRNGAGQDGAAGAPGICLITEYF